MPSVILSDNGVSSGSSGLKTTAASDGSLALQTTTAGGAATTAVTIDTAQNVGFGVTPSAWSASFKAIQLGTKGAFYGSTSATVIADNVYNDGSAKYLTTAAAGNYVQSGGTHYWQIAGSGTAGNAISFTQAMTLDSSGNLLVGTTGLPNGTSVYGFGLGPTTNGRTVLYQASNQTTSQTLQAYYNPNGNVGSISTSGSLTSYNVSSDYRLKENIVPLTGALAKISALKPSVYNYKADPSTQIEGFIAHELAEVVPHAVTGSKDAVDEEGNPVYQGVDASFLIPHLVAAIQELTARIEALENK